MKRDHNGQRILCYAINTKAVDRPVKTTWITPEKIKPSQIKKHLCTEGPFKCAECGLCAFGRLVAVESMHNTKAAVNT